MLGRSLPADVVHDEHRRSEDAHKEAQVDGDLLGETDRSVARRAGGHVAQVVRVERSAGLHAHILVGHQPGEGLRDAGSDHG